MPVPRPSRAARDESAHPLTWTILFLGLYTFFIVGRTQEIVPVLQSIRVVLILGILTVAAWLTAPGTLHEKLGLSERVPRSILALVVIAALTVPLSVWPGQAFATLTSGYSKIVLLFLILVYACRSIADVRRVLWACILGPAVLVAHGLLSEAAEESRFAGGSQAYDANDLAFNLVMVLPLALYLGRSSRPLGKLVAAAIVVLFLYGIVLTQSRGGFLALVITGIVFLRRSPMNGSAKVLIAGSALVVFAAFAGQEYWERIETIWAPRDEYDRSGNERTKVWATGLTLIATRPWGSGIGCAATAEGLSHEGRGAWMTAHNSFLQIGIELGIVGLAIFVVLLATTFLNLREVQTRGPPRTEDESGEAREQVVPIAAALELSLWGYLAAGFFLSQAYSYVLYVVLGLSVACTRLAQAGAPVPEAKARTVGWSPLGGRASTAGRVAGAGEPRAAGGARR